MPTVNHLLEPAKKLWGQCVCQIKRWLDSWMRPGYIEDHNKHVVSCFLLFQLIPLSVVSDAYKGYGYLVKIVGMGLQPCPSLRKSVSILYLKDTEILPCSSFVAAQDELQVVDCNF